MYLKTNINTLQHKYKYFHLLYSYMYTIIYILGNIGDPLQLCSVSGSFTSCSVSTRQEHCSLTLSNNELYDIIITLIITNTIWIYILKTLEGKGLQHVCSIVSESVCETLLVRPDTAVVLSNCSATALQCGIHKITCKPRPWTVTPSPQWSDLWHCSKFTFACYIRDQSWDRPCLPSGVTAKDQVVLWWYLQGAASGNLILRISFVHNLSDMFTLHMDKCSKLPVIKVLLVITF